MNHRHILVRATGLKHPPVNAPEVQQWLRELVDAVGMRVLMGPFAQRCYTPGNEGVTGAVVIETSHASIHVWDKVPDPFLQLDLYSCADFEVETVLDLLNDFDPMDVEWIVVDRNGEMRVVEDSKDGLL